MQHDAVLPSPGLKALRAKVPYFLARRDVKSKALLKRTAGSQADHRVSNYNRLYSGRLT